MESNPFCFMPNLVFENRNQKYGAFWMRKAYQRHLLTALMLGSILFMTGVTSPAIVDRLNKGNDEESFRFRETILTPWDDPVAKENDKPAPPQIEAPALPKADLVRFVPPVIVPDNEVTIEEVLPPQTDMNRAQASSINQAGDPNIGEEVIVEDPVNVEGSRLIGLEQPVADVEDSEIFIAEQMPAYPGGVEALQKFLQQEVKYPEIARKAGVEGRVFVTFVVGKDGAIRDVTVARGIGAGCDEEAIRAVKAMPRWIPGKQRGAPVSVRFSMPITFKLR